MTRGFVGLVGVLLTLLCFSKASVAGIDLGDESFKINMITPGRPFEIVENTASQRKTSTALHFGELRQYGSDAIGRRASKPDLTFFYLQDFITAKTEGDLEHKYISSSFKFNPEIEAALIEAKYRSEEPTAYRVEELLGMILGHAKSLMEAKQGNNAPIDVTITIPSHYGYKEREMILDAAEIAGLKVEFLVHENTAAAIAYAISRPVSNDTQIFMYYNMGSTSTKVSLVEYATVTKRKEPTLHLNILGEVSVDDLGGRAIDIVLADLLMDRYNALDARKDKPDIRGNKRVVQRFLKQAKRVKEILSSNIQGKVHMTDVEKILYKDMVTRDELEAKLEGFFAAVTKPITQVLEEAKLKAEDLNQIQLLGGGIRVPRIQSEINKFFESTLGANQTIGTHLNGDEAMCHGAAFIAANSTAARFKVKDIKLSERSPFEYFINITNLSDPTAEVKTRKLFGKNSLLGIKKKLSLSGDDNLEALVYIRHIKVVDEAAEIYQDVKEPEPILRYRFTLTDTYREKVADLKEKDRYGNSTKTFLKFELSRSGTVNLVQADVEYEEMREVSKKVKKEVEEEPEEEKNEDAEEKKDEEKKEESSEKDEGEKEEEKKEEEKKEDEKKEQPKEKKKKKKKYEYETVTSLVETRRIENMEVEKTRLTKNLSANEIAQIKAHLKELDQADKIKVQSSETLSNLESRLYEIRDNLEGVKKFAADEEYIWLSDAVVREMTWLEEESFRSTLDEIKEKKREIDMKWTGIHNRKQTHDELPPALTKGFETLKNIEKKVEALQKEREWLEEKDIKKVSEVVEEVRTYLDEKDKELKEILSHETPSTRASVVETKVKRAKEAYKKLEKKKKPAEKKPGQYITVDGEEIHIDDFNNQFINVNKGDKKKEDKEAEDL